MLIGFAQKLFLAFSRSPHCHPIPETHRIFGHVSDFLGSQLPQMCSKSGWFISNQIPEEGFNFTYTDIGYDAPASCTIDFPRP